ncbi:MAG TPA: hypothetical protein VL485_12860 [Ktedonobacteraceae bacterium]|nr:hypothetical protein [Ktedonobacteraceae bacterium]
MTTEITSTQQNTTQPASRLKKRWLPLVLLLAMEGAFLLLKAVLPLRGIWYSAVLHATPAQWLLQPTQLLFPGRALTPTLIGVYNAPPPGQLQGWLSTALLLVVISLLFLAYMLAIRFLPSLVSLPYIFAGTALMGVTCMLIPVVSSADIYSYIAYARMQAFYHLNPLVSAPLLIKHDPIFLHVYWINQPSAYGPTWLDLSSLLQWLCASLGFQSITVMVLTLRLLGLCAHLASILLVWQISRHLLNRTSIHTNQWSTQALLAFAWNPLLLFEACTNAHNDTVMLFFILLAVWFLVQQQAHNVYPLWSIACMAVMLALATCLKINVVLLLPGFLLFLWTKPRRIYTTISLLIAYGAAILLLYVPYWDGRSMLTILHVNPGTYRNINTLVDFLCHFYNSIVARLGFPAGGEIGSPAEQITRLASIGLFAAAYIASCWHTLLRKPLLTPLQLIRWLAGIWLLYCAIGTPWFWPWYLVTFFGLYALIEASEEEATKLKLPFLGELRLPLAVRLLTFSMLSLYCFYTYVPFATMVPKLPHFRWAHLRGLWAWLLPLLALKPLPFLAKNDENSSNPCDL